MQLIEFSNFVTQGMYLWAADKYIIFLFQKFFRQNSIFESSLAVESVVKIFIFCIMLWGRE